MNLKRKIIGLLLMVSLLVTVFTVGFALVGNAAGESSKGEIDVWLIGGQSNAVGYGSNELPATYLDGDSRYEEGFDNVLFYGDYQTSECACNEGCPDEFVPVTVGLGKHNASSCVTVGAEIGIAKALSSGNRQNAIIKYAWGGTFIYPTTDGTPARDWGTWTPPSYLERYSISTDGTLTGALYTGFVETVAEGVAKLKAEGYTPVLRGMWWMQGEAESPYEARANEYDELLECLISDVRADMTEIFGTNQSNMPFVLGNIYRNKTTNTDGSFKFEQVEYLHNVNERQYAVASRLSNVIVISNGDDAEWGYEVDGYTDRDFFGQLDGWHFNSQTQHYFGERFVNAVIESEGKFSVTLDGANATMSGGGAYEEGETVTVTVAPEEGCNITSVQANGGAVALNDLGGGKYSFTMPGSNVVISVISADPNAKVCEYGVIPAKYTDAEKYPFLFFKNGTLIAGFENWGSFVNANSISGATMLMQRDYTFAQTESNWGICYTKELTLDLGGHELSSEKGTFFMLMTRDTPVHTTKVTLKNGNIKLADTYVKNGTTTTYNAFAFIIFSSYNNEVTTTEDNFEIIFDGINLDINSGRALVSTYTDGVIGSNGKVVFNDCTFDYTAPLRATTTLFNLVEGAKSGETVAQNKHDIQVEINGGTLKSSGTHKVTFAKYNAVRDGENSLPDSLVFGNGSDGKPFALELPLGKTLANAISSDVYPLTETTGSTTNTYTDFVNLTTPYGVIDSAYADAEKYPLVAFNADGSFKVADTWRNLMNSKLRGTSGCTVYLRRDHTTNETDATSSCWGMALINEFTLDLGGHTFTREKYHMFHASGRSADKLSCKVTVKNGTLLAKDGPLVVMNNDSSNNNSTTVDEFEIIFDGITVDISAGKYVAVCYNDQNAITDTTIKLNNCKIIRGDSNTILFALKGSDKTNKFDVHVEINGGVLTSNTVTNLNLVEYSDARDGVVPDTFKVTGGFTVEVPKSVSGYFATAYNLTDGKYYLTKSGESSTATLYRFYKVESTPYGDVPVEYVNSDSYPFLIVKDGAIVVDTSITSTQWQPLINSILGKKNGKYNSGYTVYLRRDYDTSESGDTWSLCYIKDVTFDLGGHVFTRGNKHMFQAMGREATEYSTEITVINGTLKTTYSYTLDNGSTRNAPPIISINNDSGNSGTTDKFAFYFNGITFDVSSGRGIVACQADGTVGCETTVVLNDCTIDLKDHRNGVTLFSLKESSGNKNDTQVIVNGGKMIGKKVTDSSKITFATLDDARGSVIPDSLTFGKYDGEYMTLELSASASAPAEMHGGLKFVEGSTNGTTTTFVLVPAASVGLDFAPMASVTLDSNLIFNIYIPAHTGLKSATLNGTPVALENAEGGYYLVSTELSADEGAKTLTLVVTLDLDGTSVKGTFTFSTVKYVEKLLATAGVTEAEKTLAKDMLAYVKSAYSYFDSADKAIVAEEIDAVIGNYSKTFAKVEGAGADADDIIAGVTFVLDSTPAIRFYLPESASLNGYSFKIGNTALEIADSGIETAGDCAGLTYADISLYAYRMIETITIANGANTATYHINEYYDGMDKSDTALVDIVEKFYNYCKSASDYRTLVIAK